MIRWSGLRRSRAVITVQISASKRRFFVKKRAKNFIRLATSGGRSGQSLQPQGAKRRHEVFCFFLFTKRRPSFPPLAANTQRDNSQDFI
jgi:hypothetical protein